jgi:hypothetical protein
MKVWLVVLRMFTQVVYRVFTRGMKLRCLCYGTVYIATVYVVKYYFEVVYLHACKLLYSKVSVHKYNQNQSLCDIEGAVKITVLWDIYRNI